MDWIKEILAKHNIENVDDIIASINSEFPKHATLKNEFNDVNSKYKETNAKLESLQLELNKANETIKGFKGGLSDEEIANIKNEHKNEIKNIRKEYESKIKDVNFNYWLDDYLTKNNSIDNVSLKANLDIDDIKSYDDVNVREERLKTNLASLAKEKPFLFKKEEEKQTEETENNFKYVPLDGNVEPKNTSELEQVVQEAVNGVF